MGAVRRGMTRTIIAGGAVVVALPALAGCMGSTTVSQSEVEHQVSASLEEQIGQAPDKITCPGDLEGEVGTEMRCELEAEGDTIGLTVTVTSVENNTVEFDIEVDDL